MPTLTNIQQWSRECLIHTKKLSDYVLLKKCSSNHHNFNLFKLVLLHYFLQTCIIVYFEFIVRLYSSQLIAHYA